MHKIINRVRCIYTPTYVSAIKLPSSGAFIKESQVSTASKYTIVGFTIQALTQLTILKCIIHRTLKPKIKSNNTLSEAVIINKYAI
jgi:hypothetical protein